MSGDWLFRLARHPPKQGLVLRANMWPASSTVPCCPGGVTMTCWLEGKAMMWDAEVGGSTVGNHSGLHVKSIRFGERLPLFSSAASKLLGTTMWSPAIGSGSCAHALLEITVQLRGIRKEHQQDNCSPVLLQCCSSDVPSTSAYTIVSWGSFRVPATSMKLDIAWPRFGARHCRLPSTHRLWKTLI